MQVYTGSQVLGRDGPAWQSDNRTGNSQTKKFGTPYVTSRQRSGDLNARRPAFARCGPLDRARPPPAPLSPNGLARSRENILTGPRFFARFLSNWRST